MKKYDYVIVGGGITGLALAREIKIREPDSSVLVLEKESHLGAHGSGRNSGVLHSGIYYPENSLKAKVCSEGARMMAAYCRENALAINEMGKVILPLTTEQDPALDLLAQRAKANGAVVTMLDAQQLNEIEPFASCVSGRALHSPHTAVVDPKSILQCLYNQLQQQQVDIHMNEPVIDADPQNDIVISTRGRYQYGKLYNASGQFSELVSQKFNVGHDYALLPFKGLYYKLSEKSNIRLNGLIYPVPDMNVPFLGVHSVKNHIGDIYFGPTAIPALGRENYTGLKGIAWADFKSIIENLLQQYWMDKQGFRTFAHQEAFRFFKPKFADAARALIPELKTEHLLSCDKVGIRAQLIDTKQKALVMDFLIESKGNTVHVLNAISPAFTSAFSFAKHILDNY